ncbi:MAG: methylated-DNA--[protein]-cysteine S-methyltransferase [Candidatus Binataceae bacterium]
MKMSSSTDRIEADDRTIDAMVQRAQPEIRRAMKLIRRPEARVGVVGSPIGKLFVAEGPRGLVTVHFLAIREADETLDLLRQRFDLIENEPSTAAMRRYIDSYFSGDLSVLAHPVDLSLVHSEFQRRALIRLRSVPPGAVITYQGLASAVGAPDAQRAIGTTMAKNPVPIFVPCHRVIRSDGTIGNYGGGVERKIVLLRNEGFVVKRDLKLPQKAVFGHRKSLIFCRPECGAAKRAGQVNQLIFADAAHAREAGLRACKLCHPE